MSNIQTFENFLNEGRVDISKDVVKNVNAFLKTLGVKKTINSSQYIDSQGGYTSIFQEWKKDKELEDFAIGFTSVSTNSHISIQGTKVSLMIDCIAKTHNRELLKTVVYWESMDNGKTFNAR